MTEIDIEELHTPLRELERAGGVRMSLWRFLCSYIPFLRFFNQAPPPPKPDDLPPAKVAIIGAGIGGCFAAKFLRECGGGKLELHVWAKKGSKVGGRTATFEFAGHVYETGASVIHSDNKYLSDAVEEFGLKKKGENSPDVPIGIFNGKSFLFRLGTSKLVSFIKMFWRYGFDLYRMNSKVKSLLKKFKSIYSLQANGQTYVNTTDMLGAMGGEEMSSLTDVSTHDYILNDLHWNERLVDELITGAIRMNYGQDTSVNAFTTFVSLAGMQDGYLYSVVGGNWQIAEKVLKASGASLVIEDVVSVTKTEENGKVKYTLATADGNVTEGFDVVIVANPLNLSSIQYKNFSSDVYTAASTTPYQRTVATFLKASINEEFFLQGGGSVNFPQVILTTDMDSPPFQFNSVAVEIPSEIEEEEVKEYTKPLRDDPVRVWKVFSPQLLSEAQCQSMFSKVEEKAIHDWMAYPQYHPPEKIPSFVLDDGVFYINAIEKAASAMEMSAIGAKNAALLARDYLLQQEP